MIEVGHVAYKSTDYEDDEHDWAICELEMNSFDTQSGHQLGNRINSPVSAKHNPVNITKVAEQPWSPCDVYVVTSKGLVKGALSATPFFYGALGRRKFVETFPVRLERSLGTHVHGAFFTQLRLAYMKQMWEIAVLGL